MRIVTILALTAFCAGCTAPVQHATSSGKPETTIAGTTPEKVKPLIVNRMLSAGYRITRDTQFEIAFDAPVKNVAAQVLLGSRYDSQPNARVSYSFASTGTETRVVADIAIITNPNSGFERRTEMNQAADSVQVQNILDAVRAALEPTDKKGPDLGIDVAPVTSLRGAGIKIDAPRGLYITKVDGGSAAERIGIKKGDVILSYNGVPTNNVFEYDTQIRTSNPNGIATLIIWREGVERSMTLKFGEPSRKTLSHRKK